MSINFIKTSQTELERLESNTAALERLDGAICFIIDEENKNNKLAIIDKGNIKYIGSDVEINPDDIEIDLNDYLKLTNQSLLLNNNYEQKILVGAVDLNTITNKISINNSNNSNFSFSAGQGQALGLNSIAIGSFISEPILSNISVTSVLADSRSAEMRIVDNQDENTDASTEQNDNGEGSASYTRNTTSNYSKIKFQTGENSNITTYLNSISNNCLAFLSYNSNIIHCSMIENIEKIDPTGNKNEYYITLQDPITYPENYNGEGIQITINKIINSTTSGSNSMVIGSGLTNSAQSSMILGQFNRDISNDSSSTKRIFVIGSGKGESSRKNTIEIDENGCFYLLGSNSQNSLLNTKIIDNTDYIFINDLSKIQTVKNNQNKTLVEALKEEITGVEEEDNEIDLFISPIIQGPPAGVSNPEQWINNLVNNAKDNKNYLWLDTSIGNGILKHSYVDSSNRRHWIPISSAYT